MLRSVGKRAVGFALSLVLVCSVSLPCFAAYNMPFTLSNEEESAYLVNMQTGEVLIDVEADEIRYIASTTKMMTALLLLESGYDLSTVVTIPSRLAQEFSDIQAENGADMKLKIGEEITMKDLLYGLLLRSANDAASVIADVLGEGDIKAFVDQMNTRAEQLGCTDTNFTCAHGLYDAGNVSTARDLALIAAACYQEPTYMQVASTLSYTVHANNAHTQERVLVSTNFMIDPEFEYYRDYIQGMKTGFTTLAGRCFVTTAHKDGYDYMLVVLNATKEGVFADCATLLDWAFAVFSTRTLITPADAQGDVALTNCYDAQAITLYPETSVVGYGHVKDVLRVTPNIPESVKAPIEKGDIIGTATVTLGARTIGEVNLVAGQTYESKLSVDLQNVAMLLPFLLVGIVILALISLLCAHGAAPRRTASPRRRR